MTHFKVVALFYFIGLVTAHANAATETLHRWLEHQATINTWQADVKQTRRIKNLTSELQNQGRLKFIKPNKFRWELGNPTRTLAIRDGQQLLIAYPRLLQAERYPFEKITDPAMKQVLLLLEVGFPSNSDTFFDQYEASGTTRKTQSEGKNIAIIELTPKAAGARKLLERVILEVAETDLALVANELHFTDGSTLRNVFLHQQYNEALPPEILNADLSGYNISEPLSQ